MVWVWFDLVWFGLICVGFDFELIWCGLVWFDFVGFELDFEFAIDVVLICLNSIWSRLIFDFEIDFEFALLLNLVLNLIPALVWFWFDLVWFKLSLMWFELIRFDVGLNWCWFCFRCWFDVCFCLYCFDLIWAWWSVSWFELNCWR